MTLGSGGPDQTLPLGHAFYLQGDASDTSLQSVGAVFIEYSRNVWNIPGNIDCAKISSSIARLQVADDPQKPGTPLVFGASPLTTRLGAVWKPKAAGAPAGVPAVPVQGTVPLSEIQDMRVLVTGAWIRAASADKQFKFLVGADFFNSGARYCMFAYQRKSTTTDQTSAIAKAVADLATSKVACGQCVKPPAGGACAVPNAATVNDCVNTKTIASLTQIKNLLVSPDDSSATAQAKAAAIAGAILATVGDLSTRPRDILKLTQVLSQWPATPIAIPGDNAARDLASALTDADPSPPAAHAAPEDLLATIFARLLVREGVFDYVPPIPAQHGRPAVAPRFYYEKGAFDVVGLGILDNYSGFRVAKDPAAVGPVARGAPPTDPASMVFPGSKVSLKDLIMLAQHKIHYGTDYVALGDLSQKISDSLTKSTVTTGKQDADLTAFAAMLREWDALLTSSKAAADPLHMALYEWFTQTALQSCSSLPVAADAPPGNGYLKAPTPGGLLYCLPAAGGRTPPPETLGFSTSDGITPLSPFAALADQIGDQARDLQRVAKLSPSEIQSKTVDSYVTSPMDVSLQMTQKAFFTTYVTPVVGYAAYLGTHDTFWEPEVGIDVYFFPNPVDEPMWTNGSGDLRRLFAVELTVAPVAGGFGPGGRYATVNGVPPFFIGGAFQVLPYVTISTGCAVLGTKPPEVPQASTKVVASPYIGLSVQANVPDLVRALGNAGNNTTTSSGAGK